MADKEALLRQTKQSRKNRRPAHLRKLLEAWGFVRGRRTNEGVLYYHSDYPDILVGVCENKPRGHGGSEVLIDYVILCINAIERLKERMEDEEDKKNKGL